MKTIITIGRQFGSGGKEVGIRLAPANIQIMAKPASEDEEAAHDA